MSTPPRLTADLFFSSIRSPSRSYTYMSIPYLRRSAHFPSSHRIFLFLFLTTSSLLLARSPPVKSYLVTARNMLGEAHLFVRLHLSVRCVSQDTTRRNRPAAVETIENTPSRASLLHRRRISKSTPRRGTAASRRLAWLSTCRTVADDDSRNSRPAQICKRNLNVRINAWAHSRSRWNH